MCFYVTIKKAWTYSPQSLNCCFAKNPKRSVAQASDLCADFVSYNCSLYCSFFFFFFILQWCWMFWSFQWTGISPRGRWSPNTAVQLWNNMHCPTNGEWSAFLCVALHSRDLARPPVLWYTLTLKGRRWVWVSGELWLLFDAAVGQAALPAPRLLPCY